MSVPSKSELPHLSRFVRKMRSGELTTIVAYGDSVSEDGRTPGWHGGATTSDRNWAQQTGGILRAHYRNAAISVRNFGIGGQNSYEGLGRMDWLKPLHPNLVLIEFGANDCGWHVIPAECTQHAVAALIDAAQKQCDADVAVLGLAGDNPLESDWKHQDETRSAIRVAAITAQVPYIDLRQAILAATDNGRRWAEFHCGANDCHPNDTGHRIWAETVATALIEIEHAHSGVAPA